MAKIDYGIDIDLNDNSILNVAIQSVNSLPGTGVLGKIVYYTVDNTLRYWDGTQWSVVATGTIPSATTTTPKMDGTAAVGSENAWAKGDHIHPTDTSREAVDNKNAANGYAGLDANSKLSVSQIPTGNTADKIPILKATIGDGKVLKYSSADGGFIEASISAVLVYKGSCTYANLPSSGQQVGDVWNVTDAHGTTPAGTNYAWDGSAWDPLGGDIDLSNYAPKSHASTGSTYGLADASNYGHAMASSTTPKMDGTASAGSETANFARGDHIHPTDTSRASATDLTNHTSDSDIHVTAADKSTWSAKAGVYRGTITGNGTSTSFSFTHARGNIPTVQVFDSSGNYCIPKITATTTKATIVFNTAPASGVTYTVVCVG